MPPRLRLRQPLWLRRPPHAPTFAALTRRTSADVAIVGGGITGAIAAWRFAREGLDVVLLEASRVGRGSTAASTALLMQEPDEDFSRLAARYGDTRTRRIWALSRQATHDFVRTVRTLEISCDLAGRDSVYYGLTPGDERRLRAEWRRRRRAGGGGRWLDTAGLRATANVDGSGAIVTSGNAEVDPFKACLGFARAAAAEGARIHEHSAVERIAVTKDGVTAFTRRGSVDAARLVVATGYATPYFAPLEARFRMLQTYVAATPRLSSRERERLGLGPIMLWDTGRPYHYARWSPDGRLLLGGGDRPRITGRRRERAIAAGVQEIRTFFTARYPALASIPFELAWEGLFATTPDGLPYIGPHRRYPKHLFALGYGGNGMTFAYLAAQLLLDWHLGRDSRDLQLFGFGRMR